MHCKKWVLIRRIDVSYESKEYYADHNYQLPMLKIAKKKK